MLKTAPSSTLNAQPSTAQRPLLRVPACKPLVGIETVASHLGAEYGTEDVSELADLGTLAWVWNFATKGAERRELRFLWAEVEHYKLTLGHRPKEWSWEQVLKLVLPQPHDNPVIAWSRLMQRWSASADMALYLVNEGSPVAVPGSSWRRGRGGAALVTRSSVVEFLKERRVQ
jgi:hypothetical protein